jgi:hypothetical protein
MCLLKLSALGKPLLAYLQVWTGQYKIRASGTVSGCLAWMCLLRPWPDGKPELGQLGTGQW